MVIMRKYGKIVNISSNSGFGVALIGETAYAVSKAGVIELTKNSAFELGKYNININCVAPGSTNTRMFRGGKSDEEYAKKIDKFFSCLWILYFRFYGAIVYSKCLIL
jgi:NAD(P)-dependent dehydrogenase (short-subunit alcohol dehydrogenase family)